MNDTPLRGTPRLQEHDRLVFELVGEASQEIETLRAANARLQALDVMAWRKLQNSAHNLAARAGALKLGVMQKSAQELEQFAAEVLSGDGTNHTRNLYAVQVAIETIAREVAELKARLGPVA
jgi:uncharacterized protein with beta-barrel porin domain